MNKLISIERYTFWLIICLTAAKVVAELFNAPLLPIDFILWPLVVYLLLAGVIILLGLRKNKNI